MSKGSTLHSEASIHRLTTPSLIGPWTVWTLLPSSPPLPLPSLPPPHPGRRTLQQTATDAVDQWPFIKPMQAAAVAAAVAAAAGAVAAAAAAAAAGAVVVAGAAAAAAAAG